MKNYSILYQVILNHYRTRGKVREEKEKKTTTKCHMIHTPSTIFIHIRMSYNIFSYIPPKFHTIIKNERNEEPFPLTPLIPMDHTRPTSLLKK